MRLVLFDIDGTLLSARGAGRRALGRALERVYGTSGAIDGYDFRGKTDRRIVMELMVGAGLAGEAVRARLDDCFEDYVRSLVEEIGDGHGVVTLPGVAQLVSVLASTPGVLLGLLTGNIEAGARVKLGPTGLGPYFRMGAFGSDDADRKRLPSLAARRAEALSGHRFRPQEVLVIGDTPLDIECARAFGAVAVAVATGQHARAELLAEAPDLLFDSFADADGAAVELLRA
ncbi:MAG: HAD hydrolase-like protein [Candidatus Rokubacteria bacterium]|nr:HAD hydrolase-like protein [Candidatus Rokubacteria bacterium]